MIWCIIISMIEMNGIGAVISFVAGWFGTQIIKMGIAISKKGLRGALAHSTRPGGMPSGHTAGFVALTTFLALAEGFNSSVFGLALAVTTVIVYDALNVRYAVGELGKTMEEVAEKVDPKIKTPRITKGHKLVEVLVGAILGMAIGWLVFVLI